MKLSALYEKKQERPELELIVTVYDINQGKNQELMGCCLVLKEYAAYVNQVRKFTKTLPIEKAVEEAVNYCIEHDILQDFLLKNRAEVIAMCIFEYNEEKHFQSIKEQGIEIGREQGVEIGETRLTELLQALNASNRVEDTNRAL